MLFNEPKLLKLSIAGHRAHAYLRFSALQRAEIAEIAMLCSLYPIFYWSFSALQRAEIAEISRRVHDDRALRPVSVLFNEPKLLKFLESCSTADV